jgi:predicted metal-dependent HD superfamily phosphohydrolase
VILRERWHRTWSDFGLPVPASSVLDDLLARYSEASRSYHTTQHLEECFEQFARASHLATHSGEVQVALWFHDAIYDTRSPHNEERSAAWATEVLAAAGASPQAQLRVRELVLATRHNAEPESADARLTVDIDLSILGAPPARFDEYEAQVRREYSWVPDPAFGQARAKILREFLARPSVYATEVFRERLEARARSNLARSLTRLGA